MQSSATQKITIFNSVVGYIRSVIQQFAMREITTSEDFTSGMCGPMQSDIIEGRSWRSIASEFLTSFIAKSSGSPPRSSPAISEDSCRWAAGT